ncbi:MAG: hypothetical protein ACREDS_11060, partial [Limisphaerales bacterium]
VQRKKLLGQGFYLMQGCLRSQTQLSKFMNQKQLANVLIKILGLSLIAHVFNGCNQRSRLSASGHARW